MTPAILLLASVGVGLTALRETYGDKLAPEDRHMLEQMERDVDEAIALLRGAEGARELKG